MTYALIPHSDCIQRSDGAVIPPDVRNQDYQTYIEWLAQGNTPTPAQPS